jgi:hypothetical protein
MIREQRAGRTFDLFSVHLSLITESNLYSYSCLRFSILVSRFSSPLLITFQLITNHTYNRSTSPGGNPHEQPTPHHHPCPFASARRYVDRSRLVHPALAGLQPGIGCLLPAVDPFLAEDAHQALGLLRHHHPHPLFQFHDLRCGLSWTYFCLRH